MLPSWNFSHCLLYKYTKGGSPFFSKLLMHFILEPLGGVTVTVQGRLLTNGPHKLKGHIVVFIFGPHATSILPSKQEQELASPGTDEAWCYPYFLSFSHYPTEFCFVIKKGRREREFHSISKSRQNNILNITHFYYWVFTSWTRISYFFKEAVSSTPLFLLLFFIYFYFLFFTSAQNKH